MKYLLVFFALIFVIGNANSAVIELSNGDTIHADILKRTDTSITISHPALGEINISTTQLNTIDGKVFASSPSSENEKTAKTPNTDQQEIKTADASDSNPTEQVTKTDEHSGLFGTNFRLLRGWSHKVGAGFNGKRGNTDSTTMRIDYRGRYEDERKRWAIRSIYDFNAGDENDASNDFNFRATRDWLRPDSPWFYFATGNYEWDEYKVWDHRITGTIGTGYDIISRKDLLLIGRLGIAGQQTIGGTDPGFVPEFMFGGDVDKTFSDMHSLKLVTAFFQSLQSSGGWRNITNLDWDIMLSRERSGLGVTVSLENEYESQPDPGDVNNDFKYLFKLTWNWDT